MSYAEAQAAGRPFGVVARAPARTDLSRVPLVCLKAMLILYSVIGWHVLWGLVPYWVAPLMIGLAFCLLRRDGLPGREDGKRFVLAAVLLTFWSIPGLLVADDTYRALRSVLNWGSSLAIFVLAAFAIRRWRDVVSLGRLYVLIHIAGLILALAQVTGVTEWRAGSAYLGSASGFEGMTFLFGKNYLPLCAAGAALLVLPTRRPQRQRDSMVAAALITIGVIGILLSRSRSTQIGLLLGFALLLWRSPWRGVLLLSAVSLSGIGLVAYESEKWQQLFANTTGYGDDSSAGRVALWRSALHIVAANPIFGVGGQNFRAHFLEYLPSNQLALGFTVYLDPYGVDPHNVPLGIAAEHGLPALFAFLFLLFQAWRVAKRLWMDRRAPLRMRQLGLLVAVFLLMFFFDMNFHNYFNDNNMWLILGVLYGSLRLYDPQAGTGETVASRTRTHLRRPLAGNPRWTSRPRREAPPGVAAGS